MNDSDYAIVVGVSRYPTLRAPAPGAPHDLQGPDADAQAMYAWLTDPDGGGVPESQAYLINSALFPNPFAVERLGPTTRIKARPDREDIEGTFGWVDACFEACGKMKLGRRLTVYFSGHGFSVGDADGGIYDACASPRKLSHFYVRSWFDRFYRMAMFEEYVLWVDACSDVIPISAPSAAMMPIEDSPDMANGRAFVAYSSRGGRLSVERPGPDGQVHGVFTMALLDGLKGKARDPDTGHVTTDGLARHLRRAMPSYMTDADLDNPDIGKEPAFGARDELDFGAPAADDGRIAVTLRFDPRHEGQDVQVLDNAFAPLEEGVVRDATWEVRLPAGLFKAVVPATGGSLLFEVDGRRADAALVS